MSQFIRPDALRIAADIVVAPTPTELSAAAHARAEIDRSFELPAGLYGATAGLYLGFIGVMAATFGSTGLAIPLVICALCIVAGFGVPTMWARMNPANGQRALTFGTLKSRGIITATGRLGAGAATAQVLVLPVLIFAWGVAIAIIAKLA